MTIAYKRILNPVDFDDNSVATIDVAAQFARQNGGEVFLLHVVPLIGTPAGGPAYMELYQEEVQKSNKHLEALAKKHLVGVKHEVSTDIGNTVELILSAEKERKADKLDGVADVGGDFMLNADQMLLGQRFQVLVTFLHLFLVELHVGRAAGGRPDQRDDMEQKNLAAVLAGELRRDIDRGNRVVVEIDRIQYSFVSDRHE